MSHTYKSHIVEYGPEVTDPMKALKFMNSNAVNVKGRFRNIPFMLSLSALAIFIAAGIYAFFSYEVIKVDVSGPEPGGPVIVPENYKNLLVLDVTIPSFDAGRVGEDTKLHILCLTLSRRK